MFGSGILVSHFLVSLPLATLSYSDVFDVAETTLSPPRIKSVSVPLLVALGRVDEPARGQINELKWDYSGIWHNGHSPLYRGSWARRRAYCSAVMHVHWGSLRLALEGLAGCEKGLRRALVLLLPGGSNLSE